MNLRFLDSAEEEMTEATRIYEDQAVYFDDHADCDSTDLVAHLEKVATFFETGDIVPLMVENARAFVHADAACEVATVRHSAEPVPGVRASLFLERHVTAWRIRHIHFLQK